MPIADLWPAWRAEWILHEDQDLIAVDKPAGVSTHAAEADRPDDAHSRVALYLRERSEFMLLDGWPVAAAQDVALASFIAKAIFLERRGPVGFLLVMAIVGDAIAIAGVAFWYPTQPEALPAAVLPPPRPLEP